MADVIIPKFDEKAKLLSFETDRFSNYTIVYEDKVEITVDANIPATGDNGNVNLWLEIIFMSSFILFFVKKKSYAE